jgi:hypothetical protein
VNTDADHLAPAISDELKRTMASDWPAVRTRAGAVMGNLLALSLDL